MFGKLLKNKKLIVILAIGIVLAAVILIKGDKHEVFDGVIQNSEKTGWITYVNERYGFTINFPKGWKISENLGNATPAINIYKPNMSGVELPLDNFSEIPNVSIFPNGLDTQPVIGDSVISKSINSNSFDMSVELKVATDYLLNSGDVWGSMITFKNNPENWQPWGFIWMRNSVKNSDHKCERSGVEIEMNDCNPYGGDRFVRYGDVDDEIKKTEIEILKTLRFLEK